MSDFNFTSEYSVLLDHPIEECMQRLAAPDSLEPVMTLNSLAQNIEIQTPQHIAAVPLATTRDTSKLPTASEGMERTAFSMEEVVPILGGVYNRTVVIKGVQTWSKEQKCCLYESEAHGPDVIIWKLRTFVEMGEGKTKVEERIEGKCSKWLRMIVEKECRSAHQCVSVCAEGKSC